MYKIFHKRNRALILAILVLILGTAAYGFAAGLTGLPTDVYAGEGSTTVSGYAVSSLQFTLDAGNPANFGGLTFHLDGVANTVWVGLSDGATTTWYECNETVSAGETDVSCPNISGAAVLPVVGLSISAVQ